MWVMLEQRVVETEKEREVFQIPYCEAIKRHYNSDAYKSMMQNMSGTANKGRPGIIFGAAWK